jgi:uncharacterized protein YjdB
VGRVAPNVGQVAAAAPANVGRVAPANVGRVATVTYADGETKDVSSDSDTVWNTSDADIATVDEDGLVTAVDVGLVSITAEYKGEEASEDFAVMP